MVGRQTYTVDRSLVRSPAKERLLDDSGQVVHTHVPRCRQSSLLLAYGIVEPTVPLPSRDSVPVYLTLTLINHEVTHHRSWTDRCYSRPETVIALFLSTATASYHSSFVERRSRQDIGSCPLSHPAWLYCNSVLSGVTQILSDKLLSVLNAAARLVTKLSSTT